MARADLYLDCVGTVGAAVAVSAVAAAADGVWLLM